MLENAIGTTLSPTKRLSISSKPSSAQGLLNPSNPYAVYRFSLRNRSALNLKLQSLGGNADIELIQDRNGNQIVDAGEIVASSRAPGRWMDSISIVGLNANTYFLKIFPPGNSSSTSQSQFSYRLVSSAKSTQNKSAVYRVVELTNEQRVRNGLLPLALNTQLAKAAQKHSKNMTLQDFFSHTGLDGSSPTTRMLKEGYNSYGAAENIYAGISSPQDAVKGWMDSSGHRANILAPTMTEIGVGYFYLRNDGGSETWNHYWTQVFSSPEYY